MPLAMAKPGLTAIFFAATLAVALGLALPACRGSDPRRRTGAGGAGGVAARTDPQPGPETVTETAAERGQHLALLHSNDLEGEYENCGCPSHPLGGLARRATVIDRARAEADGVLVVDAGDMLLPAGAPPGKNGPATKVASPGEVERRARMLLAAFARMGIAAFLPGEKDLTVGPEKLKKWLKEERVPAVASNLLERGGHLVFEKDRIVDVAGLRVGIFGVVSPQPEDAGLWTRWALRAAPAESTARDEVASLRARGAQIVVALLHVGPLNAANRLLNQRLTRIRI